MVNNESINYQIIVHSRRGVFVACKFAFKILCFSQFLFFYLAGGGHNHSHDIPHDHGDTTTAGTTTAGPTTTSAGDDDHGHTHNLMFR